MEMKLFEKDNHVYHCPKCDKSWIMMNETTWKYAYMVPMNGSTTFSELICNICDVNDQLDLLAELAPSWDGVPDESVLCDDYEVLSD